MKRFIKMLFGIKPTREEDLALIFRRDPQTGYLLLASYYQNECPQFKGTGRDYKSPSGCVTVCEDIYGPEVHVNGVNEMLDCIPDAYGLTRDQAHHLYDAILSCVPGTVGSVNKLQAKLNKEIQ